MTSYRFQIKQCQTCDCKFIAMSTASCNTFGAKFYTDGFVDGPMYDEGSALLACPKCHNYLWQKDLPTVESMGESEFRRRSFELGRIPWAEEVRGRQYDDVLHLALWKTPDQEKYIRVRAWWSFNNDHREHFSEAFVIPLEQELNLLRLLELFDTNNQNDSIMKAEVLRQLGQFDKCIKQLEQPFQENYLPTIDAIKTLANSKKGRLER